MSAKTSNLPLGGLYVVENEIGPLMTAMRRGVRWSSHSHQDEDQDPLLKGLSSLREALNEVKVLHQIEPGVFIAPFLEIIRSEETTGPVTSLALASLKKFLSYGLIDADHPAIAPCVEAIADAVTHARFVGTDASNDGVVLERIMEVLCALVLSPSGDHLSNESVCEIMLSCFRICFETRLSEQLRKSAEDYLKDMVQHLFLRLPQFAVDPQGLSIKKMRTNSIESTRTKSKKSKSHPKPKTKVSVDEMDDPEAQLMSPIDRMKKGHLATTPVTPAGNIVDMQGSLNNLQTPESVGKPDENSSTPKTENPDVGNANGQEESAAGHQNVEKTPEQVNKVQSLENSESRPIVNNQACLEKKNLLQSPTGSVEDLSSVTEDSNTIKLPNVQVSENCESLNGIQPQYVPYGSLCVRELFRFLVSLCNPVDKQNTEGMTHLGLTLLQVSLEVAADALSNFPSLLALAKDELSRYLIMLLGTERISILAANLQVAFSLFESQREHLKFQMEQFIIKLVDIINSDSSRISYDQRELALEAIVRLWRLPGFPTELFLNYDCGLYSINLYEELTKMFSKVLFNNASALIGNMYSLQFISLDAIFSVVAAMEARCKGYTDVLRPSRYVSVPTLSDDYREELIKMKARKRWLAIGSEKFNENPREGIAKLSECGLLGDQPGVVDPELIAKYLRENPTLDKKVIGEYLSKKENTSILHLFTHSFNLQNTRIDQALRQFVETFRLPGEAPLISMILEKFADHWFESNERPFASADAAFTLTYAIIMLNVDQHNTNVRKTTNTMTVEDFKKNLKSINGGADFDHEMIEEIYQSIKSEEIIMPAEQTGLVKENYLWKCLLRRGNNPESYYVKVGNSYHEKLDKDLAERAWAPIISALCRAYDKAPDRILQRKVAQTFLSCAAISAHYGMTSDMDTLIVSLCKFTGLATAGGEADNQVVLKLGRSGSRQLATRTLFRIAHLHGNALRASWKNVVDCLQTLFKAKLLPTNLTEGKDFLDSSGKVTLIREPTTPKAPPVEQGILSSLYSYIALDSSRVPQHTEALMRKRSTECVASCSIKQIIEESKFLELDALEFLVTALVSVDTQDEGISVFLLELLLDVTIQNRDRVTCIWPAIQEHLDRLLTTSARDNYPYLLERVTVGMLRLAIRLLRGEELGYSVLPPLVPLTCLPSASSPPLSRQISYGLFELLKIGAANIHTTEDWKVVFSLLECSGAGALQPKQQSITPMEEPLSSRSPVSILDPRPGSPIPEWVLVSPTGTEAPLPVAADVIVLDREFQPHDPASLVKSCESLTFLVRDVAHVTPYNFELCVRCVRTFAEAVLFSFNKRVRHHNVALEESMIASYQQAPIQLLELMHTLHTKTAQVFKWWADESGNPSPSLWTQAWRPLLQGIARLCCDSRRPVRTAAIAYLQSTLLTHDLGQLSDLEWSQCLEQVLFPLLAQLLGPIADKDPIGVEETRVRAAMLLSKVFLHHLKPLERLPGFLPLWLTVLDLLRAYMHAENSELLYEAIPESLKNMLLVMASSGVLKSDSHLWTPTWRAIDGFLPSLKDELFPERPPAPPLPSETQPVSLVDPEDQSMAAMSSSPPIILSNSMEQYQQQQMVTLVSQPAPSLSNPVAIQPMVQQQRIYDPYQMVAIQVTNDNEIYPHQPIAETHSSPRHQQYHNLKQYQYETPETMSLPTTCANESEVLPVTDSAIYNSSAYFSEDPGTDRVFVMAKP